MVDVSMGLGPQELAIVASAFARAGLGRPDLMERIAVHAEKRLQEFSPQGLSNLSWALTTAAEQGGGRLREGAASRLQSTVVREAIHRGLEGFSPQALSNLCWSAVAAGVREKHNLLDCAAVAALPILRRCGHALIPIPFPMCVFEHFLFTFVRRLLRFPAGAPLGSFSTPTASFHHACLCPSPLLRAPLPFFTVHHLEGSHSMLSPPRLVPSSGFNVLSGSIAIHPFPSPCCDQRGKRRKLTSEQSPHNRRANGVCLVPSTGSLLRSWQ